MRDTESRRSDRDGNLHHLDPDEPCYVAGHRGLAGSAIWRRLREEGLRRLVGATSSELDLRDRGAAFRFFAEVRPRVVVLAAARVGGIVANSARPAEFISDNLRIQTNVLDAALHVGTPRLLFLASSSVYPEHSAGPIGEDALLTGPPDPTVEAYAVAKIAGMAQVRAVRREHRLPWISVVPTNLYGVGDNFDPVSSHVLPGLLHRLHEAVVSGAPEVVVWGTGRPRREFLHADDLARACVLALRRYDDPVPLNVGVGEDVTIRELVGTVARVVGFTGRVVYDGAKPDGVASRLLDVSRLRALGFRPQVTLEDGIRSTYEWYLAQAGVLRGAVAAPAAPAAAPVAAHSGG